MKAAALTLFFGWASFAAEDVHPLSIRVEGMDTVVRGTGTLSLAGGRSANGFTVVVDGRTILPANTQNRQVLWNSATVWNGVHTLQAIGRNSEGEIVERSQVVRVVTQNGDGRVRFVNPPSDKPLSGTVMWKVDATHPAGIEAIVYAVDGNFLGVQYGDTKATYALNSTALPNGRHQFFAAAYTRAKSPQPAGMAETWFTVENGHSFLRLDSNWAELNLRPGRETSVRVSAVYTDGKHTDVSTEARFQSTRPEVATVEANGTVQARSEGRASINAHWNGHTVSVPTQVSLTSGVPHFSRSGELLTSYDPKRSIFVRSMFGLGPDEIGTHPELGTKLGAAAINTLTGSFYRHPNGQGELSYQSWRTEFDKRWQQFEGVANQFRASLLITGDDLARRPEDLSRSIQDPTAAKSIDYALRKAQSSRIVVGLDMVDEVDFLWGVDPAPPADPWLTKSPPVPSSAFSQLSRRLKQSAPSLAISWPVSGLAAASTAAKWMGNPNFSDYASNYWTNMDWRLLYPEGASLPQLRSALDRVTLGRAPFLQPRKPSLLLVSAVGPFYTKHRGGSEYLAGHDDLQAPASRIDSIPAQIFYAAASGSAGVRVYHYDWDLWKTERERAPLDRGDLQTGTHPEGPGADRWQALSSAFNLIQRLEPWFVGERLNSLFLGPEFVTAGRKAEGGNMFLATNFSEIPQTVAVPLRAYAIEGRENLWRFRLLRDRLSFERSNFVDVQQVTFEPGETVVWVIRGKLTSN